MARRPRGSTPSIAAAAAPAPAAPVACLGRAARAALFALAAPVALVVGSAADAAAQSYRFEVPGGQGLQWFKGNTHTHTLESDGDSPPDYVASWYKEHGYQFLVLSDHNVYTDPARLSQFVDSSFILIAGEEVTSSFGRLPIHVNGLNIPHRVEPQKDSTLVGTIQKNVDAVRRVEGVPHINHPNYRWAIGAAELGRVERYKLFEIYNGHPLVHNAGGDNYPGLEEVWDILLTQGMRVYGIAVDDAHHFQGEFGPDRVNPGRGWVVVRAARLEAGEIMSGLEEGRFYASTGVEIEDVRVTPTRIEIVIRQQRDYKYTTRFIGAGGRKLAEVGGTQPTFELTAPTPYVRARVRDSGGRVAWIQPLFVAIEPDALGRSR